MEISKSVIIFFTKNSPKHKLWAIEFELKNGDCFTYLKY